MDFQGSGGYHVRFADGKTGVLSKSAFEYIDYDDTEREGQKAKRIY